MMIAERADPSDRRIRVGLDVGGTKTEAVAVAADGGILGSVRRPTVAGEIGVVATIVDAVRELRTAVGAADHDVAAIGVGIPGVIDPASGRVLHAVNLGLQALDIPARVSPVLGVPIAVENDVKAAALGASALHGGSGSMGYLNLGTGVAAGIVTGGRLWRGAHGSAGEIGHIGVDPAGRECTCGQRGCIETLCGGGALARAWNRPGDLPVRDLFDAAEHGDALACELRADLARGAAAAVRVLVLSVDVDSVIIGGGITALGERLRLDVAAALRRDAETSPFLRSLRLDERIELLPSGSPAAALGAALIGGAAAPGILTTDKEIVTHG